MWREETKNPERKLENYHLENLVLFYDRTQEPFCTENMLQVTALRYVCVYACAYVHANTCSYVPLLSSSKPQPLNKGGWGVGENKVSVVGVKRVD